MLAGSLRLRRLIHALTILFGLAAVALAIFFRLPDPDAGLAATRWVKIGLAGAAFTVSLPALAALYFRAWAFPVIITMALGYPVLSLVRGWTPRRSDRAFLLISLAAVVLLPTALRPQLPVKAEAGHRLVWVTEPRYVLGARLGLFQRLDGTPCAYSLLEWGGNDRLYYQADCVKGSNVWHGLELSTGTERSVWMFDPTSGHRPSKVDGSPSALVRKPRRMDNQHLGRVTGLAPAKGNPDGPLLRSGSTLGSPDAQWTAVIVTMFYEPQEIVLLSSHDGSIARR